MILSLTREELYHRHQLSHQQIDDFLGDNKSGEYPESKAQHLSKLHAFLKVSELFEKENIKFIPQKGPVLSYRLYGDPLYRAYNDLDFLISEELISRAAILLLKNGFQAPFYCLPEDECHRQLLYKHVNELFLYSPALDTGIELHWNLFNGRVIKQEDYNHLLSANKTEIQFEGRSYTIFENELEILFLVIHGGLHGWSKLKWLIDIVVFMQKYQINKEQFSSLAQQLNAHRLVSVCNELLKVYFPGTLLLPSTTKASHRMVSFANRQITKPNKEKSITDFLSFFRNSWQAFPGIRYKLSLFRNSIFATDLAGSYWMPCSAVVYYVVSPFWKLFRGFR